MTNVPHPPGSEEAPSGPDDPGDGQADGRSRPLSRPGWGRRDVETVEPEEIVVDATRRYVLDSVCPWDVVGDVQVGRQIGGPTITTVEGPPDDDGLAEFPAGEEGIVVAFETRFPPGPPGPPGPPSGNTEVRFLRADAPESVRSGQRFAVWAELPCAPAGLGWREAALRPLQVAATGTPVSIDLHVTGGLKVLSDTTCTVTIFPGRDSDPVRFELEADAAGPATITLRAFALPSDYLGQLRLSIPVNDAVAGRHQSVESPPLIVGASPTRSATLEVDLDPQRQLLSFQLRGPGDIGVQRRVTVTLTQAIEDIAKGLQDQLDQIAKGSGLSPKAVEALLRGIGADMWDRLLPPTVKDVLLRNLPHLDAVVFVGADDPIPWELLLPVVSGSTHSFLADQLLVMRWAFDAPSPKLQVGSGAIRYVLPESAPPAALAEIVQLEALLGKGRRIGTLDALLDELTDAAFGLLHFAAHNFVAGSQPASAWVKLDQPFRQGMLGADRANAFSKAAPLVFMNACNSGAASPLWVGSTGWAGRFLAAGAGAFVGSLWQVRDGPAKEFATSFYTQMRGGKTLGEAFQTARRHVGKDGDPTRLGYTLFGNAAATLALQSGEPS